MEKIFLAALQITSGLGYAGIERLMQHFNTAANIWQATEEEILESKCLSEILCKKLFRHRQNFDIEKAANSWNKSNIKLLSVFANDYPEALKNIHNPPAILFCRGKLDNKRKLAIVGSRKFSVYGKSIAQNLSADLAAQEFTIVSGAAHGIDTFAHRGALSTGTTVAVLGCGVNIAYPRENKKLLDEIAEKGAVISEYDPQAQPLAGFFPARNRIISGMSLGTIVVEAATRSGSLITAEMALSEGRDVFAVPGSIYSEQSAGCNHLIQQGAKLVTCAQDVYNEYDTSVQSKQNEQQINFNSDEEKKVYEMLSYDQPLSLDEIIYKLRSDVSNISFVLLQMKLRGLVEETVLGTYVRSVKEIV